VGLEVSSFLISRECKQSSVRGEGSLGGALTDVVEPRFVLLVPLAVAHSRLLDQFAAPSHAMTATALSMAPDSAAGGLSRSRGFNRQNLLEKRIRTGKQFPSPSPGVSRPVRLPLEHHLEGHGL
jgi:hypothetical protein